LRPSSLDISLPEFPPDIQWVNTPFVRLSTLLGRSATLVWFWDCCSLNSLRALPYVREWSRRYTDDGLRVVGVHSPQFSFAGDRGMVEEQARKLKIEFAVAVDSSYELWRLYGNELWPALYLGDRRGMLRWYHFGEGEYEATEREIHELLLEIDEQLALPDPMSPLRDTDRPGALVRAPTPHRYLQEDRTAREARAGDELAVSYQGAGAAAVLDGDGEVEVLLDGQPLRTFRLEGPGLYELVQSEGHEAHELRLRFRAAARAYAFSFAPAATEPGALRSELRRPGSRGAS
jgi:hypothetical protein